MTPEDVVAMLSSKLAYTGLIDSDACVWEPSVTEVAMTELIVAYVKDDGSNEAVTFRITVEEN
jgi:hypothetical protein